MADESSLVAYRPEEVVPLGLVVLCFKVCRAHAINHTHDTLQHAPAKQCTGG